MGWPRYHPAAIIEDMDMADLADSQLADHRLCYYQTRLAWSVDQGSNKNHSPAYNFAPTVTKFCPSHMTQNLVTVGAKLWTAERFLADPWSMDYADPVW